MEKPDVFGCFRRSLKSKKISGRFHFWTFGFLEFAPIFALKSCDEKCFKCFWS